MGLRCSSTGGRPGAAAVLLIVGAVVLTGCGSSKWQCHWDVTYDYDYGNDVVCKRGLTDFERPRIEGLAGSVPSDYEAALNARDGLGAN